MTAKNLQNFLQSLSETAFVRVEGERYRWDPLKGKGPLRGELPWQIQTWEIDARSGELVQTAFSIRLNAELFLHNLEDNLKSRFPSFRSASLEADKKGGYWLLVEFLDQGLDADQSRLIENDEVSAIELPHGLTAIHLSVIQALGQLSIFMTKHCLIGNTPGAFFIELPKILNQSLFGAALQDKSHFNSYLITMMSEEIRSALIDYCRFSADTLMQVTEGVEKSFGQIKLNFEAKNWKLAWVSGEETPELLVPPMEILEQKEVARRFQRLDELILLEDFQGALDQCRDYLEKNPQSLYLVRRWAFLTLWADLPFEKKYLELMIKYDPQNLMTLSMSVREAFVRGNLDYLLESLSKLGTTLGQSVTDFDTLDITSLTLPEMLGDAWNHKDPERAVSCYERVLHARGEIPRILVKLIRLMRDIEDSASEETYMDRLLACEVPTRTRAAIYFRLAEIKQKVDPSDACQWALKSWHTHRVQVRYATLAADLLIQLGRPHDAVHVLVETSEILESNRSAARIGLELKIASIWLELMQRLDLASERVNRALDLVAEDLEAFDEIIALIRKFEDSALLIDVTVRALKLAHAKDDELRVRRYAEVLLQLVDAGKDEERAKDVYRAVIPFVLLEVRDYQEIFQHREWDLNFSEIVELAERHLKSLPASDSAPFYLLFGDVAQDRFEESEKIQSYYENALNSGLTNARSFDFLDSHYSRLGMNSERFNLLEKKLEQAQGSERGVLLRELYYFDEGVSDSAKDKYAIEILREDSDDVGPIEERLQHYEMLHDGASIVAIMQDIRALKFEASITKSFLVAGLESLRIANAANRFAHLHEILTELRDLGDDEISLAKLTVRYLWDAEDSKDAQKALTFLIERDEIPEMPLGEMLDRIDDTKLKVELLLKLADRASDFEATLSHERTALRLVREDTLLVGLRLDIQKRLSTKVEFTVAELQAYLEDCATFGRSQERLACISAQLKLNKHGDTIVFIKNAIQDMIVSLDATDVDSKTELKKLIQDLDLNLSIGLRLRWLETFGADLELHDLDYFHLLLTDSRYWSERGLILNLLEFHMSQAEDFSAGKDWVNHFLKRLMAEHHDETFRYFIDEPSIASLLNPDTIRAAMDYSSLMKDPLAFEHFWKLRLNTLRQGPETVEFLRETHKQFHDLGADLVFVESMERLVELAGGQAIADVNFEILLYFADMLADVGGHPKRHRQLLESLRMERPSEGRVSAALIACYREQKAEGELFELLEKVLPSLIGDPRPLKDYQISLTGLELEFDELKTKVEKVREAERFKEEARLLEEVRLREEERLKAEERERKHTIPSTRLDHETLFSPPRDDDRPTDFSQDFAPASLPLASDMFSMQVSTEISRVSRAQGIELPESAPQAPEFGFQMGLDESVAPIRSAPLHTSIAELPGSAPSSFRLDQTETLANLESEEAVSLYETTNVYTPVSELNQPPPPPAVPTFAAEFASSVSTIPSISLVHPESRPLLELEAEPERSDLSQAWKLVAKSAKPDNGLLKELLSRPLSEPTEQLVAVQVAALVEDKISTLDHFPQRVWRDPQSIRYELKWTGRMTRDQFHPGIKMPLARLLKALYPVFVQAFSREMGLSGVADRLKLRPDEIMKIRKPIDFQDEVLQRSNLRYYISAFQDSGYNLFHLPSIGDRFQFDFEKRDIYIDRNHYMATPSTHIFHRLAFLLRAVSLDYIPFLHLSPSGEIYPFLMKCKRSLDQNEGVKRVLGMEKDPVRQILSQAKDRDHLMTLFNEVGNLSADRISQTVSHFIEQIYRLNLAETLDLVGLVETIAGVDLSNPRASSYQRINQSNAAKSILSFAAELKFTKDP